MDRAPRPAAAHARAGMKIIELIMTVVVAAIVLAIALPRLQPALARRDVSNATRALAALAGQARAQAVSTGRSVELHVAGDVVWLTAQPRRAPVCTGCIADTVGAVRDFGQEYGVTLTASQSGYTLDGRGLAANPAVSLRVRVQKGLAVDSVELSGYGRLRS